MALPVPGADEVNLVAKVGSSVVHGLSQPSQPPPWPNTRDALLELLAILDEWSHRAKETTRYAERLARMRRNAEMLARKRKNLPASAPADAPLIEGNRISGISGSFDNAMNIQAGYMGIVQADIQKTLTGQVPPFAKLRRSSKRRAARRGLRTVLVAYCPDLLEQFDAATAARSDWVGKYHEDFDRWFGESHTEEEVNQLLKEMTRTQTILLEVTADLRAFITTNFPLTNYAEGR